MISQALVIPKERTSEILNRLRDTGIINRDMKIGHIDDQVYIPITTEDLTQYLPDINYEILQFDFEQRHTRPASLKDALSQLLPDLEPDIYQTSFDQIGTIAIIDLNDELVPYAETVGKALMLSNPSITTVYRKSSKVDGLLRIRGLELIGGERLTETIHKEHGLNIAIDVEKAYFSPRLATEHARITDLVPEGSLVLDMFGSLAPFALHLTHDKDIEVDTLDINPHVPELIRKSVDLNKLQGQINIYCQDAHQFAEEHDPAYYDYIIMNHPSGAFDFLMDAIQLVKTGGTIFYYDFVEIENYQMRIHQKLEDFTTIDIDAIHVVRQSSPSEYHVCVSLLRSKREEMPDQIAHQ